MSQHQTSRKLCAMALLVGLALFGCSNKQVFGYPSNDKIVVHTITAGQSLWSISRQYGVTVKELIEWNKISNPNKIAIGNKLQIYLPKGVTYLKNSSKQVGISYAQRRFSNNDLELLARIIYAEARGEDFAGQVAVGAVVLNRLDNPNFPKTLHGVIYQPGAFTAINDQQIKLNPDETAHMAAQAAINGDDPTGGALFYYNPSIARDKWIKTRPVLKVIGNHTFAS